MQFKIIINCIKILYIRILFMEASLLKSLFDAAAFGRRLKKLRIKNNMTQEQLAEKIGTVTSSVSHLENGTHAPSLNTLLSLCKVFGTGVDELLSDSLPVKSAYLDKDIAELIEDCTPLEKQMIKEIIQVTLSALREYNQNESGENDS